MKLYVAIKLFSPILAVGFFPLRGYTDREITIIMIAMSGIFAAAALLVLCGIIWYLRHPASTARSVRSFSLDDLGKLKADGKLSNEEYQRLKDLKPANTDPAKNPLPLKTLKHVRYRFCPKCGYDLRATPGRCPECGTVTSPTQQSI